MGRVSVVSEISIDFEVVWQARQGREDGGEGTRVAASPVCNSHRSGSHRAPCIDADKHGRGTLSARGHQSYNLANVVL